MGSCQGIREVAGEYVQIEGAREAYLHNRRDLLKNKDWEAGVDCLEWAMGSLWWEWSFGYRFFFWRWQREFRISIRDGQKQWQVGPWPRFLQPQGLERDDKVAEK